MADLNTFLKRLDEQVAQARTTGRTKADRDSASLRGAHEALPDLSYG